MFGPFKERWERRRKIRFDRKHLEERSRRFLKSYLEADDKRKLQFFRAVEDISKRCQPAELDLAQPELDDARIAEATCEAAIRMVRDHDFRKKKDDRTADFVTDASRR